MFDSTFWPVGVNGMVSSDPAPEVVLELPVPVIEMIDRVAVRTQQQQVLAGVVPAVPVDMMNFQDLGYGVPSTALAAATAFGEQRLSVDRPVDSFPLLVVPVPSAAARTEATRLLGAVP